MNHDDDLRLGRLRGAAARRRFGELVVETALPTGPVDTDACLVEVPPEGWRPWPRCAELDEEEAHDLHARAGWVDPDHATPRQLRRARAFALWLLGPRLEQVAALTVLIDRARPG